MIEAIEIPTPAGTFDALSSGAAGGREVMLLHGFPQSARVWEYQLGVLGGGGCHAVAPDQRGYSPGVRPQRVAEYRLDELVGDVLAVADALDWTRFDLIGHDWGAHIAWAAAAAAPDRIRTLSALSHPHPAALRRATAEDEDQAQRSHYLAQLRQPRTAERNLLADNATGLRRFFEWRIPEDRIDDYVHRLTEPEALTAALNWYRAMDQSGPTPEIQVPTLYVWSTEDPAIGSTAAQYTAGYVTAPYRFEMLEDLSHWLPEEAPEATTRLILQHLLAHRS